MGGIQGTITDVTGAGVAGARIVVQSRDRGFARTTESDGEGHFYLGALTAGDWALHVEREGFAPLDVAAFPISLGQTVVQRWALSLKSVQGAVEVNEQPDVLEASETTSSVSLGGDRIEEAPARGRNYVGFVALAPGVAQSAAGAQQHSMTGIRSPLSDSGFTFTGIRARNNGISIDGVDNRDETTGGNRVAVGLEMVQEFRVAGVSAGAEFGGAAGGLINVITRTGVNQWHGDGTFFYQDELLNARKPEMEVTSRPEYNRIQPGASDHGPDSERAHLFRCRRGTRAGDRTGVVRNASVGGGTNQQRSRWQQVSLQRPVSDVPARHGRHIQVQSSDRREGRAGDPIFLGPRTRTRGCAGPRQLPGRFGCREQPHGGSFPGRELDTGYLAESGK